MDEPHVYIYIPPGGPGDKGVRRIMSATSINKFSITKYKTNPEFYKDKAMKLKKGPAGEKVFCYILYAGDTFETVDNYIKTTKKRFHIPKLHLSSIMDSLQETNNSESDLVSPSAATAMAELKKAKQTRKNTNVTKKMSSKKTYGNIVKTYVNDTSMIAPVDTSNSPSANILMLSRSPLAAATSTPKKDLPFNIHAEQSDNLDDVDNAMENAYKMQVEYFKKKYTESEKEKQELLKLKEQNTHVNDSITMKCYENLFLQPHLARQTVPEPASNLENVAPPQSNIIHINKGVHCNATAYKDAFKTKRCQKFFTIINRGIYGVEDLANRCVRKQKNTQDLRQLSPVKREVVEDEFFKFLTVKGYPPHLISDEMDKCSSYHHKSITSARRVLYRSNE